MYLTINMLDSDSLQQGTKPHMLHDQVTAVYYQMTGHSHFRQGEQPPGGGENLSTVTHIPHWETF